MAGHFSEFGMLPDLVKGIEEMGWFLPTDIQAEAIPMILGGGDVLMAAETGSGKTGAFCLPVIQIVYENLHFQSSSSSRDDKSKMKVSKPADVWEMNKFDRSEAFAISSDGLLCQSRDQRQWHGARSTLGVMSGCYYYEVKVTDEGLCRVGFSTGTSTLDVGIDAGSFGFGGTGKKSNCKQFDTYGEPFGLGDVMGCFIDLDQGTIKYSKNGFDFGIAFDIPKRLLGSAFFASVTLKNAELRFNFGATPFQHPPRNGYKALCEAEKSEVTSKKVGSKVPFTNKSSPAALILEPSRELANQTHDQICLFKKHLPKPYIKNTLLVGGQNNRDQIQELQSGVDIVTGTPGKVDDFISSGKLSLSQVRFLIFDEVDGLLNQNHGRLLERLYGMCPKSGSDGKRLQLVVCSATLHNFEVKKLANKIMHFPTWIDLKGQDSVPDTLHHVVCYVDPRKDGSWKTVQPRIQTDGIHRNDDVRAPNTSDESLSEAVKLLKGEYVTRAIRRLKMDHGIIFCRTKLDCDNLERFLQKKGPEFSCICLHGDRQPKERNQNLLLFKDRKANFLICTDVAARGLDIKGVPFVINVTLPDDKANYVHRIGRVGRADRMGLAISFVAKCKEKVWYHKCESRGRNCNNARLLEKGGCTIWYDEPKYLGEIEEHLGETISEVGDDMVVPVNEFDGKVVYGTKQRTKKGTDYKYHSAELAPAVAELARLEKQVQMSFLKLKSDWRTATT